MTENNEIHDSNSHEDLDKKIEAYLDSLGATLWGRAFDINAKDSRQQAVEFIRKTVLGVDRGYNR